MPAGESFTLKILPKLEALFSGVIVAVAGVLSLDFAIRFEHY
jgi:hypothetical protein